MLDSALSSAGPSGLVRSTLTACWCRSALLGHVHAGVPGVSHHSQRWPLHSSHVRHTGEPLGATLPALMSSGYLLHHWHGCGTDCCWISRRISLIVKTCSVVSSGPSSSGMPS